MDFILIGLLVGLLAAVSAVVYLALGRGRLLAEAAAARADRERAEAERAKSELELKDRAARIDDLSTQRSALELKGVESRQQLESQSKLHAAELRREQEVMAANVRAMEVRERDLKEQVAQRDAAMRETFKALAAETLSQSTREFLKLAGERFAAGEQVAAAELDKRREAVERLVAPIGEALRKTDDKLAAIEKERTAAYSTIAEQIRGVSQVSEVLRSETAKLVRALRDPHVRGVYGEIQLRKVAELAGMSAYCDFTTQDQTLDGQGNPLKPDMVVRLPSDRVIVVDAKTNIRAYLEAIEAESPAQQEECLDRFAGHVASTAAALARKKYWAQYDGSPEFVVMFIPGDQFVDAALSRRPEILEDAARQGVILASPSTLIGLLRAVAIGYKEKRLAESAAELRTLGVELHDRAARVWELAAKIGESLSTTVDRYNSFVGSAEGRLLPTLRKFEESGAKSGKEIEQMPQVTVTPRLFAGAERVADQADDGRAGK